MKKTRLITGLIVFLIMATVGCIQGVALRLTLMGMTLMENAFTNSLLFIAWDPLLAPLQNPFIALAGGLLITVVTAVAMPGQLITFGILHFFGCCMLLYAAAHRLLEKIPVAFGATVSFLMYFVTRNLYYTVTGVPHSFLLFALGFRTGHSSADYYPMIPWIFLFLAGGFLGRLFARGTVPDVFKKDPVPALSWLGRHTMIIYLLHQPVVYGAMVLWFDILR